MAELNGKGFLVYRARRNYSNPQAAPTSITKAVVIAGKTKKRGHLRIKPSQKICNYSPGFEWGGRGDGEAQLALAILLDYTGAPNKAVLHCQGFKHTFLAQAEKHGFDITADQIEEFLSRQAAPIQQSRSAILSPQ